MEEVGFSRLLDLLLKTLDFEINVLESDLTDLLEVMDLDLEEEEWGVSSVLTVSSRDLALILSL